MIGKRVQINPLAATLSLLLWGFCGWGLGCCSVVPIAAAIEDRLRSIEPLHAIGRVTAMISTKILRPKLPPRSHARQPLFLAKAYPTCAEKRCVRAFPPPLLRWPLITLPACQGSGRQNRGCQKAAPTTTAKSPRIAVGFGLPCHSPAAQSVAQVALSLRNDPSSGAHPKSA